MSGCYPEHCMKSFQHLAKKKQDRSADVSSGFFSKYAICNVQDLMNTLKRFHPTGQKEKPMVCVIRGLQ